MDNRVEALIAIGIDEEKAKKSVAALDAMKKGTEATQKAAEQATRRFREMAEAGAKLREVGATFAASGAAILAPLTAAATQYAERFKGLEPAANAFNAALQRQKDATSALGREAASALVPSLNKIAEIQEKIASIAKNNPELVRGAVNVGVGLAAGGAALLAVGQATSTIGRLGELLNSGGIIGGAGQAVIAIGALAAGAKGAEAGLNLLGKATGNSYLEHYKLSDALKTAREAIAAAFLGLANTFVEAKKTFSELKAIIELSIDKIRVNVDNAFDILATGIRKAINSIESAIGDLRNGLAVFLDNLGQQLKIPALQELAKGVYDPNAVRDKSGSNIYNYKNQQEDEDLANRGDVRAKWLADQSGSKSGQINQDYEQDKTNLKKLADFFAKFGETGSLGGPVDNLLGGIKDKITDTLGNLTGGAAGKGAGVGGPSPEAIRMFVDYQQKLKETTRQQKEALNELQRNFDQGEIKAQIEKNNARQKIDVDYMRSSLKITQDFLQTEKREQQKASLERLRLIQDANDQLYDAAAANDVVGFLTQQRNFQKQLSRSDQDASIAERQRSEDYQKQQAELATQREQQLQDLETSAEQQRQARLRDYENQRADLLRKQEQERALLRQNFAQQLAGLSENLLGLNSMQNQYYQVMSKNFAAYLQANANVLKADIERLYGQTSGQSGGSNGPGQSSNLLPSSGGGGGNISRYADGGVKYGDGLAYLHDREIILNQAQQRNVAASMQSAPTVNIDMSGAVLTGGATKADLAAVEKSIYKGVAAGLAQGGLGNAGRA